MAVAGVILFHIGVPQLGGGFFGVDVFFVISGYLITSLLLVELKTFGRIDFVRFWARRTRRILPSALLVIAATLCVGAFVVSDLKLFDTARDAIYAALYVINWQQLAASLDYFNDEVGKSLFLHYWSLAIEEQFYLFLALAFAIALRSRGFLAQARSDAVKPILVGILTVSGIASFIAMLGVEPPVAFFGTQARIWELSFGATAALLERGGWVPTAASRSTMAWLGATAISLAFAAYGRPPEGAGVYTLLPTAGAFFIILAGINAKSCLPLPLAVGASRLPVAIGKLSYALYLWHWPVFELYQAHFLSWTVTDKALALVLTFVLSIVSHLTIENPIRFSKRLNSWPAQTLAVAASLTILIVASAAALHSDISNKYIVLANGKIFDPEVVRGDRTMTSAISCHSLLKDPAYRTCSFGEKDSRSLLFLMGDSHALQWLAAVEPVAKELGMSLQLRTRDSCMAIDGSPGGSECDRWRIKLLDEIEHAKPEIVLIAHAPTEPITRDGVKLTGAARMTALADGERALTRRIAATGAQVVMIVAPPLLPVQPLECLLQNRRNPESCRWPKQQVLQDSSPWSFSHNSPPAGVGIVDMTDAFCSSSYCQAANDDHILMRDKQHVTSSFAASLTGRFAERLRQALRQAKSTQVYLPDLPF